MILSRKEEITWLEVVGEEGMLHSILSSLPILYEEGGKAIHSFLYQSQRPPRRLRLRTQ
jgi:hypothetical protein